MPPRRIPRPFGPFASAVAALLILLVPTTTTDAAAAGPVPATVVPHGWSLLPPPGEDQPFDRYAPALAWDEAGGYGVVFGGTNGSGNVVNETWVNDGDFVGEWRPNAAVTATPPAVVGAALAYDAFDGYFVLFGGQYANRAVSSETWIFQSPFWYNLTARLTRAPPPTYDARMAYDAADRCVVLWDSSQMSPYNTSTWTYRGGNWTPMGTGNEPSSRIDPGIAYDAATRSVVLFGGYSAMGIAPTGLNDTWQFASGAWSQVSISVAPPATVAPVMTYDPRSASLILYAGVLNAGDRTARTWGFSNGEWTPLTVPNETEPPARFGAAMYFDPHANFTVLFGGAVSRVGGPILSDAWVWGVPPGFVDPTLGAAPIPTITVVEFLVLVAAPALLVWLFRRRPPRPAPVSAPVTAPS